MVKFRFLGKEKVLVLGVWPKVSLTEARKIRNVAKLILKSWQDPYLIKKILRLKEYIDQLNTFSSIVQEWLHMRVQERKQVHFTKYLLGNTLLSANLC